VGKQERAVRFLYPLVLSCGKACGSDYKKTEFYHRKYFHTESSWFGWNLCEGMRGFYTHWCLVVGRRVGAVQDRARRQEGRWKKAEEKSFLLSWYFANLLLFSCIYNI
jgi:hypothetical protein